jgi:predicted outer membrane repeat protein
LTLLNGAPGAQLIDASPHFRNVSIEECSLRGALISGLSSPTFEACVFAGNSASGGGAVACTSGSTADFTECEFIGNGAGYAASGGAVSAQPANTTLRFFSCRFESNEVGNGGDGGAIASGGHLEVHDSLFLGNSVFDTFSSAIRSYAGGTLTVTSSTFAGNPGVAAIQTDGTTTLTRCLFAGSDRVWLTGTFDVSCTNVENGWMFNPELENANGNFSSDPLFCAPAAGNYHLQWGSPCLVANSPAGCGQIGAFGPGGCNVVSVEPETWARIKAQYR